MSRGDELGGRGVAMLARRRRARLGGFVWYLINWIAADGGGYLGGWPGHGVDGRGGRPPARKRRARRR